jgi:outer membrane protein
MKKLLFAALAGGILASTVMADALRVEMGAGGWSQKATGSVSYVDGNYAGSDTSTEQENTVGYAWIYLKHPIPVLPNIRLEYTQLKYAGDVQVSDTTNVAYSVPTTSTFDSNVYDGILYYNILDNTAWMTLDLGLDVKMFDYDYSAAKTTLYPGYTKSGTLVVPLAYARARFQIPGTGIGLEGEGSYISYDGGTFYDTRVKADWTMEFIPVVQPGIEVGYRYMKVEYNKDGSELKANIDFSGVYAGLMLRF